MNPEEHEQGIDEPAGLPDVEEADGDAEAPDAGLGAVAQLAVAVLVVAVLIAVFIAGSAVLRRVLG
jgi:hypothetical protein